MKKVKDWFVSKNLTIDLGALGSSSYEVLFLTVYSLIPLGINICIGWFVEKNLEHALFTKVVPGEILSYCLSFLAPSMYLLTKTHGTGYKLPFLHMFSVITLVIYASTTVFYLIAKNKLIPEIDMNAHTMDPYFSLALVFLLVTVIFRLYSVYHGKNASTYSLTRKRLDDEFVSKFKDELNG